MTDESEAERRGLDDGGQDFGKIAWRVRAAGTDRSSFEVPSRAQPGHIFQFRYSRTLKGCDYYRCSDCTAAAAGDQRLLLKKTVRVRDAMLLSDPERPGGAAHLCLMPAQQRPRPPKRRHSTPDSDEETSYGAAARVHASVVAYYSRVIGHTLYFKYVGESRKQPGAQEFFCIGCAERDASYDFRVFVRDEQFVVLDPDYSDREHICRYDAKPSTETVRQYADADWADEGLRRAKALSKIQKPPRRPQGDPTPPRDAIGIGNPSTAPTGLMIPQDRRIEASAPMTPIGGAPTAAEIPLKKACYRLLAYAPRGVGPDVSASTDEADAGNGPEGSHDNTASSQSDFAAEPKADFGSPDASTSSVYSAYVELEETNSDVFDPEQCLSKIEDDQLMKIDFDDADMPSTSERSRRCHAREDSERRRMNESYGGDSVRSVAVSVNTTACREALGIKSPFGNDEEAQGADHFESVDHDGFLDAQQAAEPTSAVDATSEMSTDLDRASTTVDEDARSSAADTAETILSATHTETGTTESHKKKGKIVFDDSDEDESDQENDNEASLEDDDGDSDVEYMGITKAEPGSIAELSSRRRRRPGQIDQGPTDGNPGPSRPVLNIPSTTFGPAKYSDDGQLAYFTDLLGQTYTLELLGTARALINQRVAEVRTYQCQDCRQVLLSMGDYRPVDLPKIKVVDGFFTDIDPGRPQNNPHFCTQQLPNGENLKSCD